MMRKLEEFSEGKLKIGMENFSLIFKCQSRCVMNIENEQFTAMKCEIFQSGEKTPFREKQKNKINK